jgi:hypothetical protein
LAEPQSPTQNITISPAANIVPTIETTAVAHISTIETGSAGKNISSSKEAPIANTHITDPASTDNLIPTFKPNLVTDSHSSGIATRGERISITKDAVTADRVAVAVPRNVTNAAGTAVTGDESSDARKRPGHNRTRPKKTGGSRTPNTGTPFSWADDEE